MFFRKDSSKLSGPKDIPELVGRNLVVDEKQNPDWVWTMKGVVRPTDNKHVFYCRVFDPTKASSAGVKVNDWNSLNGHSELILWEGYFDKEKNIAHRGEVGSASSPAQK